MAKTDLTGHTLGQYTITARLGRGGMADVYKAYHPKLEVYRALKVIRPEFVTAEDFRERFQKEAQAVASLRHSNIVQIHDFGEQDDTYFMVMEFIEGQDLKRIIRSENKVRPIRRALQLIDRTADALHYAHSRGLIHRDIKPENIMVNEEGVPILTDFGIAKLLTANTQLTQTGTGIGTPAYMAPEQARALPEVGPAADIYSLSVVLYEMLTGQVPFSADTPMAVMLKTINDPMPLPRQFSGDISENLQQVLLKGTAKDPENRYATARQFQKALREIMDEGPEPTGEQTSTAVIRTADQQQPDVAAQEYGQAPGTARDDATKVRRKSGAPGRVAALVVLVLGLMAGAGVGAYFFMQADAPAGIADTADSRDLDGSQLDDGLSDDRPVDGRDRSPLAPREEAAASDGEEPAGQLAARETGEVMEATGGPREGAEPRPDDGGRFAAQEAREPAGPEGKRSHSQVPADTVSPEPRLDDGVRSAGNEAVLPAESVGERPPIETPVASASPEPAKERPVDGGLLRLGSFVGETMPVPGRPVAYRLDARAGQTIFFDYVDNHRGPRRIDFRLMAPDDETRVFRTQGDHGPVTLGEAGTYILLAEPRDDRVNGYEFVVWDVEPAEVDGGRLQLGRPVEGQTSVPGQQVSYSFQASAGQAVRLERVEASEATDFTLMAPDGSRVFRSPGDQGPRVLDQDGTYTLVAKPREDRVSRFQFVLRPAGPGE